MQDGFAGVSTQPCLCINNTIANYTHCKISCKVCIVHVTSFICPTCTFYSYPPPLIPFLHLSPFPPPPPPPPPPSPNLTHQHDQTQLHQVLMHFRFQK